jgi:alkaline phosphatase D
VHDQGISRRRFLALAGGTSLAGALPVIGASAARTWDTPRFAAGPFSLGVASGDPLPGGIVLWTRLAPDPLAPDGRGGMPELSVPVTWQIAEDPSFRTVVLTGVTRATPELGHSVHAEVSGLRPDRVYWYRFRAGRDISETGRTRTAPSTGALLSSMSFAFTSCQSHTEGHFTALRHLAEEDVDVVVHLGDYIYEDAVPSGIGRDHLPATELFSLADYRIRYGQYKRDPHLRAAHAAHPWIIGLDDHEVDDNWADDTNSEEHSGEPFLTRRAAALRAFYENTPLRRAALPSGPTMRMYRRLSYGDLLRFNVVDTRQYRDNQPCGPGRQLDCPERLDPARTMLGATQERWLLDGLDGVSTWNVMANQVILMQGDSVAGPEQGFGMDTWDGYAAARQRLIQGVQERGVDNFVVLSGDAHRSVAADLKAAFDDPGSATVGTEFLGTSISSGGDGQDRDAWGERWLAENPHMKFYNVQRGYARCEVTPTQWRTDYRVVPYVSRPGAPVFTRASIHVTAGKPGIQQVDA